MKLRTFTQFFLVGMAATVLGLAGCGGGGTAANVVTVQVSPLAVILSVNQVQNFSALVNGATDTSVTWSCTFTTTTTTTTNGTTTTTTSTPAPCTAADGVLSNQADTTVTYTAPAKVSVPAHTIQIVATSKADTKKTGTGQVAIDSGIRVSVVPNTATIATNESFSFNASILNDLPSPDGGVTWSLTKDATATSSSVACTDCGTVDSSGNYKAPGTVPTQATVTIVATSKADTARRGQGTITLINGTANPISFTGLSPDVAPQGGLFQDVYLNVRNLRSSVTVDVSPIPITPNTNALKIIPIPASTCTPSSTVTCPTSVLARLRLSADQLAKQGDLTITITDPVSGTPTSHLVHVLPFRPALVASTRDSFQANNLPNQITLDGGLFGSIGDPKVSGLFNTQLRSAISIAPRQATLNLNAGDLSVPGLFSVGVQNGAIPSIALTNLAIQPDYSGASPVLPNPSNSVPLPLGTNALPSAIAVDSVLGVAVVANEGTDSIQLIDLNGGNPIISGAPVALPPLAGTAPPPKSPTGIAIDDQLSPHIAVTVNNGDSTLTVIQLPTTPAGAASVPSNGTVDLRNLIPPPSGGSAPKPYAIGIDPYSHQAIVAYSSSNVGFLVNLDPTKTDNSICLPITAQQAPYCAVASVTLNTGATPQVAVQPQVHLAYVSPGGSGLLSVVDLTQASSTVNIDPSSDPGAKRASNVVTIKTMQDHNINPAVGGAVLITGVTPSTFNGSFQVTSVIDAKQFTYSQTAPDEIGGGGQVSFGRPVLTFSVTPTETGVAVNPISRTAALADPNASGAQIAFISSLDQSVTSLSLSEGSFLTTPGSAPEIGARFVAFQPFTNTLVSFNPLKDQISVIDPVQPQRLALAVPTGGTAIGTFTPPGGTATTVYGGLAVDPIHNLALVANAGSNTVSVLQLGSGIKSTHINEVRVTAGSIPGALLPGATLTTSSTPTPTPLGTVQIFGTGLNTNPQVRLDGQVSPAITVLPSSTNERLDVTIPASYLSAARHFALDVVSGGVTSNAVDFTVAASIDVSTSCAGTSTPQPTAVAIDDQREIAIVSNKGCASVSVIDLNPANTATYGTVVGSASVGTSPAGVAVIPRLGLAVVANNGSGNASVLDLSTVNPTVKATVTVGTSPLGVAINQDTGRAIVVNNGSNSISSIDLNAATPTAVTGVVDQQPVAVAIDPDRAIAVVTSLQFNTSLGLPPSGVLDVVDVSSTTPIKSTTLSVAGISATPTGVTFDAATSLFYASSSQGNTITAFNPTLGQTSTFRVGVNPTSLAYNFQTGTLLSVNSASKTISVIDSQTFRTRATLAVGGSSQFAAAIHPRTNLAVITDEANNRVLLLPLPK